MTFTIEPMLTLGTDDYDMWDDGWTVVTADRRRTRAVRAHPAGHRRRVRRSSRSPDLAADSRVACRHGDADDLAADRPHPRHRRRRQRLQGAGARRARATMVTERVRIDTPYPCPPRDLRDSARASSSSSCPATTGSRSASRAWSGAATSYNIPSLSRREYGGPPTRSRPRLGGIRPRGRPCAPRSRRRSRWPTTPTCRAAPSSQGDGLRVRDDPRHRGRHRAVHDGLLLPHLELSHAPFRKGESFENQLGDAERKNIGNKRWSFAPAQGARGLRQVPVLRPHLPGRWQRQAPRAEELPAQGRHRLQHGRDPRRRPAVGHGPARVSRAGRWIFVRDSTIMRA